jgi:hypothetical protein
MSGARTFNAEDMANAEHLVLETGVHERLQLENEPPLDERRLTVERNIELNDRARGIETKMVIYREGVLRVRQKQRKKELKSHLLLLRYLDPVPSASEHRATRVLYGAGACAGVAALAFVLAQFAPARSVALPLGIVALTAGLVAGVLAAYLSHRRVTFYTLHGRSAAIDLKAGFGYRRRLRAMLPTLSAAITQAAAAVSDDTATFLREEMREHYRLRSEGILTTEACTEGTGRILARFDESA